MPTIVGGDAPSKSILSKDILALLISINARVKRYKPLRVHWNAVLSDVMYNA
jgi:hypothetical protein